MYGGRPPCSHRSNLSPAESPPSLSRTPHTPHIPTLGLPISTTTAPQHRTPSPQIPTQEVSRRNAGTQPQTQRSSISHTCMRASMHASPILPTRYINIPAMQYISVHTGTLSLSQPRGCAPRARARAAPQHQNGFCTCIPSHTVADKDGFGSGFGPPVRPPGSMT